MVRAKLKVTGAARTFGVLVFFAACVAGLTGCNGVPGEDFGLRAEAAGGGQRGARARGG